MGAGVARPAAAYTWLPSGLPSHISPGSLLPCPPPYTHTAQLPGKGEASRRIFKRRLSFKMQLKCQQLFSHSTNAGREQCSLPPGSSHHHASGHFGAAWRDVLSASLST